MTIADLKLYQTISWLIGGSLDGVPTTCLDDYPLTLDLKDNVKRNPDIAAWYEKKGDAPYSTADYVPGMGS